jgi:hypothetical protein
MSRLSEEFNINIDSILLRSFEYKNQKFNVRIPKTKEAEEIYAKSENPPTELVEEKYKELTKTVFEKKDEIQESDAKITFLENDVIVGDTSMRGLAKAQAGSEIRIVESFKLLVTVDGKNLADITYDEINQDIPKPIQYELVKRIAEVISPNYEELRKN